MLITPWLKLFAARLRSFGRRLVGSQGMSLRPAPRLAFERLEDRTLLATFTVNSLADNNTLDTVLTLREAMGLINGTINPGFISAQEAAQINFAQPIGTNDTIQFDPSIAGGTINLNGTALPDVSSSVAINGDPTLTAASTSINPITINGGNTSGIFTASGAANLALGALNLTGGSSPRGGAVFSTSTGGLSITLSTISGNTATGTGLPAGQYAGGGGVYHAGNSIVIASTVSGNTAYNGGGLYSMGGGITVLNSTVSGNNAIAGGGIWTYTGNIGLQNSTVSGNMAGAGFGSLGGGIYTDDGNVVLYNTTVTNNSAVNYGGISINEDGMGEMLTIRNSIVAGNTAANVNDVYFDPDGSGAAPTIQASLIGDNSGLNALPATAGTTPDTNGNFVGTNASPINPLLGPLQDNGGALGTQTHSLLSGSLAIDSGNNAYTLGASYDQRYSPMFPRIQNGTVDMGSFEGPLSISNNVANVVTGSTNDRIIFRTSNGILRVITLGPGGGASAFRIPGTVTQVNIDTGAGNDFINTLGTAGPDQVTTTPFGFQLEQNAGNPGPEVTGQNLEIVIIDGQGGNDTATLNDSAGNDKLFVRPNSAVLFASDISFQSNVFGFNITGIATTGNDLFRIFDSPGNDTITASPSNVTIAGPGFSHTGQQWDTLLAVSLGGNDTVNVTGTGANEFFTGRNGFSAFTSGGFNLLFDSWETVNVNGQGGTDLVRFVGGPGNDILNSGPSSATFQTTASLMSTTSFERLVASAGGGANNVAVLTDSAGNDIFNGGPNAGELSGAGFFQRTTGFNAITIRGINGGVNTLINNGINYPLIQVGTWV